MFSCSVRKNVIFKFTLSLIALIFSFENKAQSEEDFNALFSKLQQACGFDEKGDNRIRATRTSLRAKESAKLEQDYIHKHSEAWGRYLADTLLDKPEESRIFAMKTAIEEHNFAHAHGRLALAYIDGKGVEQDYTLAKFHAEEAASRGEITGAYVLSKYYAVASPSDQEQRFWTCLASLFVSPFESPYFMPDSFGHTSRTTLAYMLWTGVAIQKHKTLAFNLAKYNLQFKYGVHVDSLGHLHLLLMEAFYLGETQPTNLLKAKTHAKEAFLNDQDDGLRWLARLHLKKENGKYYPTQKSFALVKYGQIRGISFDDKFISFLRQAVDDDTEFKIDEYVVDCTRSGLPENVIDCIEAWKISN